MVSSTRTAASTEADLEGSSPEVGEHVPARRRPVALSLAILLVPATVGLVRLLIGLHRPFAQSGDAAILETAVRRVVSGTQALGPYSRFGFHQPGPAYFFVQAPFSWLTGGSPRSLFLGALTVNFGAAVASVAVVRRFGGEPAARWSAAVIAAYLLFVTPALLTDPWNPYVLGLPLLLTILLVTAAATKRSLPAAAGAAVTGSYVVQTHVGTAATMVVVFAVAAAFAVTKGVYRRVDRPGRPWEARPDGVPGRRRWALFVAAGAAMCLFWIPPLVEEATHSPGNLTKLARFFGRAHPEYDAGIDHRVVTASTQVAEQLVTLPFGRATADDRPSRARSVRDGAAAVGLLVAAGVAFSGWRRRDAFVTALGLMPLAACPVAVWSATRIVGEVMPYLLVWAGVLLLPTWIAAGLLLRPVSHRRAAGGVPGAAPSVAGLAVVVGLALTWSILRAPLPSVRSDPAVPAVMTMVRPWLAGHSTERLRVRIGQHDQWPLAAGVIDRLDRDGLDVTVDREWVSLFGDQFAPTGREGSELWLTGPTATPPARDPQHLGTVSGASVWAALPDQRGRP